MIDIEVAKIQRRLMTVSDPKNIGDIYRATDYPMTGSVAYGAAYRRCSNIRESKRGSWAAQFEWWIEMGDGDCYRFGSDIMGATLELVRRNPLPHPGSDRE